MASDLTPDSKVFTRVWVVRFGISVVSTAIVAWGVSFWIADYVVRAHIAGMNSTFSGVQGSLDQINRSIQENTAEMTKLTAQSAAQGTEIGFLRRDLGRVEQAVQNYGIAIPALGAVEGGFVINTAKWDELEKAFGSTGERPIFLEIKAPSIEREN
ncbi:MAG TPA: hypothetical protein PKD10_05205 [Paracoccaceae bacterium]|nr:hypothetical protein [Paracoccaceae bacterium]HMO70090.1 hypothetical protein [Paracoccaceae bacterium]